MLPEPGRNGLPDPGGTTSPPRVNAIRPREDQAGEWSRPPPEGQPPQHATTQIEDVEVGARIRLGTARAAEHELAPIRRPGWLAVVGGLLCEQAEIGAVATHHSQPGTGVEREPLAIRRPGR
jgi:hypothetical protein